MNGLSKEYLLLFNAVTETVLTLDRLREELLRVQQQAEELYLLRTDPQEDAPAQI